jgi:hypothetical protein
LNRWIAEERAIVERRHDTFAGAIGALVSNAAQGI